MMRLKTIALAAALGVTVAGCDDDYLTTVPTDRVSDETFWQSERDFTTAVNAAYREMIGPLLAYLDNPSDLAYSQQYFATMSDVARGLHDALSGPHTDIWEEMYVGISRANEVLTQLETAEEGVLSEAAENRIRGQALFLRGYYYHELLWLFGGVPLLTEVPTPEEALSVERASRDEVFARIVEDLDAAAQLLPVDWTGGDEGRATQGAALAYKARAALYEAGYHDNGPGDAARADELYRIAAEAARAVMDLGVYDLHPDFGELFTYGGESSPEIIFAHQVNAGQNAWDPWYDFAPSSQGGQNVALSGTRALVDKFYLEDGLLPSESPLYDPTPPVITYTNGVGTVQGGLGMYANRDPRFYATLFFPGAEQFDGTIFNPYPDSPTPEAIDPGNFYNTVLGYLPRKYLDPSDRSNPQNSGINVIKMRYADVLLMYAEAKVELGEIDQSVYNALNEIRDRVDMPHVQPASQPELLELIRNERAVELAFEGLRYADLRRWRIADEVMPGFAYGIDYYNDAGEIVTARSDVQRVFDPERDYLWPVPASERELNSNLTQNPGY